MAASPLKAKAFSGISTYHPIALQNVTFDLNTTDAIILKRKISEESITLAHGVDDLIPFKKIDTLKIASLSISSGQRTEFQNYLSKYAKVDPFRLIKNQMPLHLYRYTKN